MELDTAGDPLVAVLDMLAAHAERLSQLDGQLAANAGATARVGELAALARQLDHRITVLAARLDKIVPLGEPGWDEQEAGYQPVPSRRWWRLEGRDRERALTGLRDWVEQIYRPGYGQLAATLAPCWDQHALCLYALDILAELWSVLYLADCRPAGTLTAQAEYQARILPALAEQMATETTRCRHRRDQYRPVTSPAGSTR